LHGDFAFLVRYYTGEEGGEMLRLLIATVVAGLMATSNLQAQVTLDVAKLSCEQFATSSVANPDRIAIWLNGYYHGKRGDTQVDTERLTEDAKKIQQYCIKNPDTPLMQAVESVLGAP
jgi:acid stress chaperone HdeB